MSLWRQLKLNSDCNSSVHLELLLPVWQQHELEDADGSHMPVDVLVDLGTALKFKRRLIEIVFTNVDYFLTRRAVLWNDQVKYTKLKLL